MTRKKSSASTGGLEPGEKLYEDVVRALARRARSTGEVRLLLQKKGASRDRVEQIVARLRENGYLNDARFAGYFVSSRLVNDLYGRARVRKDLLARQVSPEIAGEAIGRAYEDVDEAALLREYLRRKVRLPRAPQKPVAVVSLCRRLLRAGFASATIVQELKRMLPSPLLKGRATEVEPPSWDELLDSLPESSATEADFDQ